MKKLTKPAFIFLLSISTLLIGIGAISTTSAQEISTENVLLQKLDALVEQLANLATNNHNDPSSPDTGYSLSQVIGWGQVGANANPSCIDGYLGWPTSTQRKNGSPWDMHFMPFEYGLNNDRRENFLDLNGDGLVDYLYSDKYVYSDRPTEETCVYLNNGAGWDKVYRCVYNDYTGKFHGDCAQI